MTLLSNKVMLITGISIGICEGTVRWLAGAGGANLYAIEKPHEVDINELVVRRFAA